MESQVDTRALDAAVAEHVPDSFDRGALPKQMDREGVPQDMGTAGRKRDRGAARPGIKGINHGRVLDRSGRSAYAEEHPPACELWTSAADIIDQSRADLLGELAQDQIDYVDVVNDAEENIAFMMVGRRELDVPW